jgi:class 3 adenylate cyclase
LIAQVVFDQCESKKLPFLELGELTPKGFDQPIRVYELKWAEA